jgi:hypothetical protein
VINDLLDPTGQNLRVREDAQVFNTTYCDPSFHEKMYYLLDLIYVGL